MVPDTLSGLLLTAAFVVPGIVYQAVRARFVGETPANRDVTNKLMRALAASLVIDVVYLIVLGPTVVRVATDDDRAFGWLQIHARGAAVAALLLVFVVPAAAAWSVARAPRLRDRLVARRPGGRLDPGRRSPARLARYDPTPTAWDWAVDHGVTNTGFVRVLGTDGVWRGGAYGDRSYFSSYPEPCAVFLEEAWLVDTAGVLLCAQTSSAGVWIPCEQAAVVEFLTAVPTTP